MSRRILSDQYQPHQHELTSLLLFDLGFESINAIKVHQKLFQTFNSINSMTNDQTSEVYGLKNGKIWP